MLEVIGGSTPSRSPRGILGWPHPMGCAIRTDRCPDGALGSGRPRTSSRRQTDARNEVGRRLKMIPVTVQVLLTSPALPLRGFARVHQTHADGLIATNQGFAKCYGGQGWDRRTVACIYCIIVHDRAVCRISRERRAAGQARFWSVSDADERQADSLPVLIPPYSVSSEGPSRRRLGLHR